RYLAYLEALIFDLYSLLEAQMGSWSVGGELLRLKRQVHQDISPHAPRRAFHIRPPIAPEFSSIQPLSLVALSQFSFSSSLPEVAESDLASLPFAPSSLDEMHLGWKQQG